MKSFISKYILPALACLALYSTNTNALRMERITVLAGGFGSCAWTGSPSELNMWTPLKDLLIKKATNTSLKSDVIVRVCFAIGNDPLYVDIIEHDKTQKTSEFKNLFYSQGTLDDLKELLLTLRDHTLEKFPEDASSLQLTLIGQSHGGDLVLKLAETLNQEFNDSPTTLITVDPISIDDCGPASFVGGLIGDGPGCKRFPRKTQSSLESIRSFANHWVHIYQDDFPFLHSGPTPYADESIDLDFQNIPGGVMGAHGLTEDDSRIWEKIESLF